MSQIQGWPPLYVTPVPEADIKRGRGSQKVAFAESLCKIAEDSIAGNAGQPLVFRGWQTELTKQLFAVGENGKLRHRRALIGLPRKGGKSAWLSSMALDELMFGAHGGQIFSCAADKDQAKIVFNTAKRMVEMEPELSEVLKVYKDSLYNPSNGSVYRALSSEAFTKEGLNPTFVAFDELHAQPNGELYEVMSLAMGARSEPMLVSITTAGVRTGSDGKDSLCYSMFNYGKKIITGELDDPSFYFAWWGASEQDDFRSEETWKKANPGYGDITSPEDFKSAIRSTPEAGFKTKRLNMWVATSDAWLPHGTWDEIADTQRVIEDGSNIVLAFDGSFNGDCTVIVAVSADEIPHIMPVAVWEKPDEAGADWQVPVLEVEDAIREASKRWQVMEIACDPYRWARTFQVLEDEGLPIVTFPQTASRMTPATTRFFEAVVNKSITQNGDPQLARHIGNAQLRVDQRGSRLAKEKRGSTRRIDLAVASVMGLERAVWWHSQGNALPQVFDPWSMDEGEVPSVWSNHNNN